jgi:hypothetical protein
MFAHQEARGKMISPRFDKRGYGRWQLLRCASVFDECTARLFKGEFAMNVI